MASLHSNTTSTQKRSGAQEHAHISTLKELFPDWTEEDLLYAIQEAEGDLEVTILRISDGHATQWGEVKGKKKTPKPKSASDSKQENRMSSQRGGFADRGGRGRGDGTRSARGGATRGAPRQNGDRQPRPVKAENGSAAVEATTTEATEATPSWDQAETINSDTPAWGDSPADTAAASAEPSWASTAAGAAAPATATTESDAWSTPATNTTTTAASDAKASVSATPPTSVRSAIIPAGSKMSWAKIVKPAPAPAPAPVPVAAPANIPATAPSTAHSAKPATSVTPAPSATVTPAAPSHIESKPEPEPIPEPTPVVVEETPAPETVKQPEPEVVEPEVEVKETPTAVPEPVAEPEVPAEESPKPITPVGPPGLKAKTPSQARRLNQDAPVVMPSGSSALDRVGVQFGSFSLNDDETAEAAPQTTATRPQEPEQAAPVATPAPAAPVAAAPVAAAPAPAPAAAPAQQQPAAQQTTQQQSYGRQPSIPSNSTGYQGATPAATSGMSPAANNSYAKQDPSAAYLGQHHHHPGMGPDAMGSPYGSYLPNPPNQLGSFGMGPMASVPNEYAALYGSDVQRMYYENGSYGQVNNSYQSRDPKYSQDSSATVSTTGASLSGTTAQAQQTLQQQQQQQQQGYPNIASGMPYYPYYYMAPNQFPNAYQQSGYGQPFVNKNMYPMYQHQQQQQHSNKSGATSSTPYGTYGASAGQGHHQYSQSGYDDLSGIHSMQGMGGLSNDPYAKYNPNMQNFLGGQQQPSTPTSSANNSKTSSSSASYNGSEKASATGSQPSTGSQISGAGQAQQPGSNQGNQQGYYQQPVFSSYQYPSHHQGYHPNQHQGSGRNQQQYWSQN